MKLDDVVRIQDGLELLEIALDCSYDEILDCHSGVLMSEEEVSEIKDSME